MSRKTFVTIAAIFVVALIGWKLYNRMNDKPESPKDEPLSIEANSDNFTRILHDDLNAYYTLKDAFVQGDTSVINASALAFADRIQALDMTEIKADTTLIALSKSLSNDIASHSKAIIEKSDLVEKRRSFQIISDALFDLLRTVQYKGSTVYQQYCPMAFDNAGAAWLSNTEEIINPYFGNKMLHCGEIRDSIRK